MYAVQFVPAGAGTAWAQFVHSHQKLSNLIHFELSNKSLQKILRFKASDMQLFLLYALETVDSVVVRFRATGRLDVQLKHLQ